MSIRVLIVDDSALVRKLLSEMLAGINDIEVVGTAADPYIAREKIKQLKPDVLTLDIEMPRMDGLTFLKNLMRLRPMPVVMISTLTEKGADVTLQALEMGAIDFIAKPKLDMANQLIIYQDELIEKIRMASVARVHALTDDAMNTNNTPKAAHFRTTDLVVSIGASAGGTEALKKLLAVMPPDFPGTVISLHIPPVFSASFANRMNSISAMQVSEAKDGDWIRPGHVFVAPGEKHLEIERRGAKYYCLILDGDRVLRHKPSVDVLFRSVAKHAGKSAIGVILTGMGNDGSEALGEIKRAGSPTIAQDERTSLVWGMPGEAVAQQSVDEILPLDKIVPRLIQLIKEHESKV